VGYRKGFAAAKAEAEQHAALALQRIAAALDELNRGLGAVEARLETEAVEVAVAVAKKLVPELMAREPFAEIAALATECFRHLVAAPHVVVRVNETLQQAARDELERITRACGFEGRLIVLAELDIAPGDCRIEWADGGVKRDRAATEAAIDEAVGRYIVALATPDSIRGSGQRDHFMSARAGHSPEEGSSARVTRRGEPCAPDISWRADQ
jgi:flagellar assembly protein FliH